MRFKLFSITLVIIFLGILSTSCDDNLDTIGGSILPPSDTIGIQVDSVFWSARTVAQDSIYARTIEGLLGRYEDDVFGTITADYLCQFYCPDSSKFHDNFLSIDSVQFVIDVKSYVGDTLNPMGISVYEVNKPLTENFYTNVDPSLFYDNNSKPIAQRAFTVAGLPYLGASTQKVLIADLGIAFGQRFYDAYKSPDNPFLNSEKFNEFFKGVYVTSDFGTGSMLKAYYTSIDIYYSFSDVVGEGEEQRDTVITSVFSLSSTPEIIQLNRIKNKVPADLFVEGTGASYIKSPTGVCTELTLPIQDIMDKIRDENNNVDLDRVVNLADLSIAGFSELENINTSTPGRFQYLLLIDKDSVSNFFSVRSSNVVDNRFCAIASRGSNNIFAFRNLSLLVSHYIKQSVEMGTTTDPKFLLIPVDVRTNQSTSSITRVYNYMELGTAILRTNRENLKMNLIFSKW